MKPYFNMFAWILYLMSLTVLHSRSLDGCVSECENVGGSVTSPVFIAIPRVSGRAVLSSRINMNTAH